MQFVAALLPVVIYIFVVYKIDNFSLISVKNLLLQVLCGMVTALACFGLFQLTGEMLADEHSDYINPVLEELVKGLPLLYLASRKKIVFFIDSVICGAAVGGGFSIGRWYHRHRHRPVPRSGGGIDPHGMQRHRCSGFDAGHSSD